MSEKRELDSIRIMNLLVQNGISGARLDYSGGGDSGDIDEITFSDHGGHQEIAKLCETYFYEHAYRFISGFENNEGGSGVLDFDVEDKQIWLRHTWNLSRELGELVVLKAVACEDLALKAAAFGATVVETEVYEDCTVYEANLRHGNKIIYGLPGIQDFLTEFTQVAENKILRHLDGEFQEGAGDIQLLVDEGILRFRWAELSDPDTETERFLVYKQERDSS
jgi:hypothetical protein